MFEGQAMFSKEIIYKIWQKSIFGSRLKEIFREGTVPYNCKTFQG